MGLCLSWLEHQGLLLLWTWIHKTGRADGGQRKVSINFGSDFGRRSAKSSSSDGKHSDRGEMVENTGNEGYLLSTQRVVL